MSETESPRELASAIAEHSEQSTVIEARMQDASEALTLHESILDVLAAVRIAARHHGYAVAWHGSMARDIDLIAVPWREIVSDPSDLVNAITKRVGGYIRHADRTRNPEKKPHGRLAWSIHLLGVGTYIDISVMPPTPEAR